MPPPLSCMRPSRSRDTGSCDEHYLSVDDELLVIYQTSTPRLDSCEIALLVKDPVRDVENLVV